MCYRCQSAEVIKGQFIFLHDNLIVEDQAGSLSHACENFLQQSLATAHCTKSPFLSQNSTLFEVNEVIFTPFCWVRLEANNFFKMIFTPFCWVRLEANYIFTPFSWVILEANYFFAPFSWVILGANYIFLPPCWWVSHYAF